LKNQLDSYHDQIEEAQGQTIIDNIRKLAIYQRLHNEIQEKMNKINDAISNRGCCAKFFCCKDKDVLRMQDDLDKLARERALLSADDATSVGKIIGERLMAERKEVESQLSALIKQEPIKNNNALLDQLARSEASIENKRKEHYYSVSDPVMFLIVKMNALLGRIKRFLEKAKENSELPPNLNLDEGIKLAGEQRAAFSKDVHHVYVPSTQQNKPSYAFEAYYDRFHALSDNDQRTIIYGQPSDELKEKILTAQTTEVRATNSLRR
jgi:hypothetical protein